MPLHTDLYYTYMPCYSGQGLKKAGYVIKLGMLHLIKGSPHMSCASLIVIKAFVCFVNSDIVLSVYIALKYMS